MSNNSDELKIELDDDVASALAAMLFDAPNDTSPPEPQVVIDLRDSVVAPDPAIPDLFAITTTDSTTPPSQLFPTRPAKSKPIASSSTPLFPTAAEVVRKNGTGGGLFGPTPTPSPSEANPPVVKSVIGPMARPSNVEFVPAGDIKAARDYRIVGGLALGAVATIGLMAFVFGGGNDAPVTSADVSLIPATQITNTTPTTVATSASTAPPTTAATTTTALTAAAPSTAAPATAAPVATSPPTTRRPTVTRPRATAAPVTTTPTTAQPATVPTLDIPPATYIVTTTVLPLPASSVPADAVATP